MENGNIRIRDMRKDERPRNRLLDKGASSLSDSELLSIILRTSSKKENAINLPQRILSQHNPKELSRIDTRQL